MPWQQGPRAESYYKQQKRTLRPGAYQRLHLNQWGSGDDKFITEEMWRKIVDEDMSRIISGATFVRRLGCIDEKKFDGRCLCFLGRGQNSGCLSQDI